MAWACLRVHDFAAPKDDHQLALVALAQEAMDVLELEGQVVLVGLGPKFYLLDDDRGLVPRDAFSFLDSSYLNLPKSMIRQTGGTAVALPPPIKVCSLSEPFRAFIGRKMPHLEHRHQMTRTFGHANAVARKHDSCPQRFRWNPNTRLP